MECDEEWTLVSPSKFRARLGFAAMEKSPSKSAIKSPASKNKKVKFATFMNYEACKGYRFLPTGRDTQTILEAGYSFSRHEISHLHVNTSVHDRPPSPPSSPTASARAVIQFGSYSATPISSEAVDSIPDPSGSLAMQCAVENASNAEL